MSKAKAKKITKKRFKEATGVNPRQDDMSRVNCEAAGAIGHMSCGWCAGCDRPKFMCHCDLRRMERTVEWTPDFELGRRQRIRAAPRPPTSLRMSESPAEEVVHVAPTLAPTPTWIEPAKRERGGNSSGLPASPMNEVELEIARADAAFLIQKEKESGDWDKWLKDQAHWREMGRDGGEERARRIIDVPEREQGPVVRRRR